MKITIIQGAFLPVPPLLGGAVEKMWHLLGREFAGRGHEVTHLSRRYTGLPETETRDGVRHCRVGGFDTPASMWRLKLLDLVYSWRCAAVLEPADVIVTNTFWLPVLPSVCRKGGVYVDVQRMPKGQMRLYSGAARLRANSRVVERAILAEVAGASERVAMIPNSLPFAPVDVSRICSYRQRAKVLLFVGRVHPEKGIHLLIEAFARLKSELRDQWAVHIVGPWSTAQGGGGEEYLKELRDAAGMLSVNFFGPVHDLEALAQHYLEARLFVYPSLAVKGETFGLAPLEAMAYGCVPVVSGLECFRDFISDGVNGASFDHDAVDPAAALAAVMERLMTDSDLCVDLSERAREVNVTHAPERIADLFLEDFQKVIQVRRRQLSDKDS